MHPQGTHCVGLTPGCSLLEYGEVLSCAQLQVVQTYLLIPLSYCHPLLPRRAFAGPGVANETTSRSEGPGLPPPAFPWGCCGGCSILSGEMVTGVWGQDLKGKVDCGPAGSSGRHTRHGGRTSGGTKNRTSVSSVFSGGSWPLEGMVVVYSDYTCTFKNQDLTLVIFGGL